jgi:peptidoglycan/xylan/chitin deacetylase (PgdA/CDA1 family)
MKRMGSRLSKLARMPWVSLRNRLETPVLVLAYHRVAPVAGDAIGMAVTPENFRAQMAYLREHYPVLRFEDDWSKADRPSVVITFDDGYADNRESALPILEELGLPAAFFISSGTIGAEGEFWWDEVEKIFLGGGDLGDLPASLSLAEGGVTGQWKTDGPEQRMRAYREVHKHLKPMDTGRRAVLLAALRKWSGRTQARPSHRALRMDELKSLAASPCVTIGAHTVSHPMLSGRPKADQEREILASRKDLESWLGKPIDVFSYPFGDHGDYNGDTLAICRAGGFRKVAAAHPGQWRKSTDPFRIPRVFIHDWTSEQFARKLKLFFNT